MTDWKKLRVGMREIVEYTWAWHECEECSTPARYRISYLLENARRNPASQGYGKDDITWCSDADTYACERHRKKLLLNPPPGFSWAGTFPLKRFKHFGFYKLQTS